MGKLFVDKTVEVNAPAREVWEVITGREYTDNWAHEFSSGGPRFHIESDWQLGSPVFWKGEDGVVNVEGNVTALDPKRFLRFTVVDVRSKEELATAEEDGITFELSEANGKTTLHILHGDFSVLADGEKYWQITNETWDRVLRGIREMAESRAG